MITYVYKSALVLALLYSLYYACLSRDTFHRLNRLCLISIMLASMVLPLVHITTSSPTAMCEIVAMPSAYLSEATVVTASDESREAPTLPSWEAILTAIYLAGIAFMLLTTIVQTWRMVRMMQGGLRHTDHEGNTIILCRGLGSSFSIFRWIVMDVDDYEHHRRYILTHEQAHIRHHHTLDLILLEVVKTLQWCNPFVWFLSRNLKTIHEYEADEAVINQGIDAKQYQQLLVMKAVGNRLQPLANNFRRGSLKQRITMMYQKKTNRWMMLKALFILPAMGLALYAFASPEAVPSIGGSTNNAPATTAPVTSTNAKGHVETRPDVNPTFPGGEVELYKFLAQHLAYPQEAIATALEGRCYCQFVVDEQGNLTDVAVVRLPGEDRKCTGEEKKKLEKAQQAIKQETLRVVGKMPRWVPGKKKGKIVKCKYCFPINFRLH